MLVKSTAAKSEIDKQVAGYYYIIEVGKNLYKAGYSSTQTRIYDYNLQESIDNLQEDFPDVKMHDNPDCVYLTLNKINNITCLEQDVKAILVESTKCQTYNNKQGTDIREYFFSTQFDNLLIDIKEKIQTYK